MDKYVIISLNVKKTAFRASTKEISIEKARSALEIYPDDYKPKIIQAHKVEQAIELNNALLK